MEKIRVGLIGLGTVGKGTADLLHTNRDIIQMRTDACISLEKILVQDIDKQRTLPEGFQGVILHDEEAFFSPMSLDIVVEAMGGTTRAFDYIVRALESGIHVVTANKDLMAEKGCYLMDLAKEKGLSLRFEASVCAGIPVISMIRESFAGNRIKSILGILNGTTNYILSKMEDEGVSFEAALREAQEKGYAESDPSSDVEGHDSARKIAILAGIAFNASLSLSDVHVEGITGITREDMEYAKELGYRIRLLGMCKETGGHIKAQVNPVLIPVSHPLASIKGAYNGIYIEADAIGKSMIYGKGAGSLPTASAIVGDIITIARNLGRSDGIGCTCIRPLPVRDILSTHTSFYTRMCVDDQPGVLAKIAHIFGKNHVSIYSVVQKKAIDGVANLIIITHKVSERNMKRSMEMINGLDEVEKVAGIIRVEEENG
ncbi:MAG: homoserine dehydrogenase [Clostridia bacterium]